jgi:hypothetical protein
MSSKERASIHDIPSEILIQILNYLEEEWPPRLPSYLTSPKTIEKYGVGHLERTWPPERPLQSTEILVEKWDQSKLGARQIITTLMRYKGEFPGRAALVNELNRRDNDYPGAEPMYTLATVSNVQNARLVSRGFYVSAWPVFVKLLEGKIWYFEWDYPALQKILSINTIASRIKFLRFAAGFMNGHNRRQQMLWCKHHETEGNSAGHGPWSSRFREQVMNRRCWMSSISFSHTLEDVDNVKTLLLELPLFKGIKVVDGTWVDREVIMSHRNWNTSFKQILLSDPTL